MIMINIHSCWLKKEWIGAEAVTSLVAVTNLFHHVNIVYNLHTFFHNINVCLLPLETLQFQEELKELNLHFDDNNFLNEN